jgi:hypothetical protein
MDASKGLMGHYRVFANGKRFGTAAWDWPSQSQLREDGSVETVWPATAERPFDLKALYRWTDPATLDVETTVIAKADLVDFESFLASYFTPAFTNASILVTTPVGSPSPNQWLPLEASRGDWQMSPRNADGTRIIKDGRWLVEPNPVNWIIVPDYAHPLGVRSESKSGVSALIMAPRDECFAVAGPQQLDAHHSLYLCLFGKTVKSGETARARARMTVVAPLTPSMAIQLYQQYPAAQNKP